MGSGKSTLPPKIEKVKLGTKALQWLRLKKPAPKPGPELKPPAELSPSPNGLKIEKVHTFDEAKKKLLEKKSDRSEILQKLDVKDKESFLDKTYKDITDKSMKPLDGILFTDRILLGLDSMAQSQSPDQYKNDYFMRNSWLIDNRLKLTPETLLFAYQWGLFFEQNPEIAPFLRAALEKYQSSLTEERESTAKELSSQQSLSLFLHGFNSLVMHETQRFREEREAREREKIAKRSIRLINFEIELIFKGKELFEIALREMEKEKPRVVKALIELGRFIQEVEKAVTKQSVSGIAEIIYKVTHKKNGEVKLEILRKVLSRTRPGKARERSAFLVAAATYIMLNRSLPKNERAEALRLLKEAIAQIARSEKDLPGELVARLNYEHELATRSTEEIAYYQARTEIATDIIRDLPEALPYLLEEGSGHRPIIEFFASTVGIKVTNPARERYESLIDELIKSPAGENHALDYVFDYLTQDEIYSKSAKTQLKALKTARLPIPELARQVISATEKEPPPAPFAGMPRAQALRELVIEIAKANDLTTDSLQKIKPKTANALILLAAKIQHMTELVRNDKLGEAQTRFEELKELNQSRKAARLEVPALELLETYLEASSFKKREEHSNINYLVMRSANGNLPAALRMLEVFQEDKDIWEDLRKLAFNLSLNIFNIQYAYCFLAQRLGGEERTLENLKSVLAQDKGGEELFLTLQKLPIAVRGQAPDIYDDVFANLDEPGHVLDILVYWNLINTSGLDHRLDRQQIAKKIVEFIQTNLDQGQLWTNLLKLAELKKYNVINNFFRRLLKNIVERSREMDHKDPFLGFKGKEYGMQISMAVRANLTTIQRALENNL